MRKSWFAAALAAVAIVAALGGARAWWVKGHETITEAAALQLPDEVPAFFRAAGKSLAHFAGDPDRWKNRDAGFLRAGESPHHFLDMEDLGGNEVPRDCFAG